MSARFLAALAAGAMLLVSGCGSMEGNTSDEPPKSESKQVSSSALKQVDPCKVLSKQQLQQFKLQGPGEPYKALP